MQSVRTAWRVARAEAGFGPEVTTYSLRYAVARWMWKKRVPTDQISIWLGHLPVGVKKVTLIYSPYDPDYLREAAEAVGSFFRVVDALVTNPLWRRSA